MSPFLYYKRINKLVEKNKQISYAGGFKVIYVAALPSRKQSITPTPRMWAAPKDFFLKSTVRKGEKLEQVYGDEPDQQSLSHVIKCNIT